MPFRWFVFILFSGAVLSVFLLSLRIFTSAKLSEIWFAWPLPFLIAWVAVTWDWVYAIILSQQ